MLHICFSICDKSGNYCQYLGVAMQSMLAHTKSKLVIHVLHDNSLSLSNQERLRGLVSKYNQELIFHLLETEGLPNPSIIRRQTIGTLFRLYMPEILIDVDKVIYLDADILVNMDISNLWNYAQGDKLIYGRKDAEHPHPLVTSKVLSRASYINAGVMAINLTGVRQQCNLREESLAFIRKYGDECIYADQDAINYIFKNKIGFLPKKCNNFTVLLRGQGKMLEECIYHFAGSDWPTNLDESFDEEFLTTLQQTSWGEVRNIYNYFLPRMSNLEHVISRMRKYISQIQRMKKIFWGVHSVNGRKIISMFYTKPDFDYYVDNNKSIWNTKNNEDGLCIYSPDVIKNEANDKVFVVVLSQAHWPEIKKQLESYGLVEGENFLDGYSLLPLSEGGRM